MMDKAPKRTRLLFIDNLGILLITLVVVFHLSVTYGASGFWPYRENPQPDDLTALLFTLFTALNGPYVVGAIFLIGWYAWASPFGSTSWSLIRSSIGGSKSRSMATRHPFGRIWASIFEATVAWVLDLFGSSRAC
jgi:hypothetical protein